MKKYENIFIKENVRLFFILFVILSFIIMIFNNFNIDPYISKFIIPIIFLLVSYIYLLKKIGLEKNNNAYYYLIPIESMIMSYLVISEGNKFLNIIVIPITISIFLYSLVNDKYKLSRNIIPNFFKLIPNRLFSNLDYLNMIKKERKNSKRFDNLIVGCCIGFPIAILLLVLLSSADRYFSLFVDKIFTFISNILNFSNLLPNAMIIFVSFCILFSVFINLLRNRNECVKQSESKQINNQIAKTVLIIVNSVFCLFIISEMSKLTTNFLHLPIEYTYAMYAREGFFQLLFVTLINISIIIYFVYYTKSISENKWIKRLVSLLIIFSIILVFNSFYRMYLYMDVYGFTILRLQVVLFLIMELLIFIIILIKILKNIKFNEMFTYFIIVITTYIINLYICNQPIIDLINRLLKVNTNI